MQTLTTASSPAVLSFGRIRNPTRSVPNPIRFGRERGTTTRRRTLKSISNYTPTTIDEPSKSKSMAAAADTPKWFQKTVTLPPQRRGCHLITPKVTLAHRINNIFSSFPPCFPSILLYLPILICTFKFFLLFSTV